MHHKIFIFLISLLFLSLAVVFCAFPRSSYSELERRDLAEFPSFNLEDVKSGKWMNDMQTWFSDTEPFRDEFMTVNMAIKDQLALNTQKIQQIMNVDEVEEDAVAFIAAPAAPQPETATPTSPSAKNVSGHENTLTADEDNAHMGNSGILVIGTAPNARALMVYGAPAKAGEKYINSVNEYHAKFGHKAKVYCMPIPTSIEFYCPDKAKKLVTSQIATINHIYDKLEGVVGVDCYSALSQHADEDIYLRTDHHWAPLGAYYAAEAFAKAAGVPFKDLSHYDRHELHGFVGTMYGYSKDISVKKSPEDFVYYTPRDVEYSTTYINYNLDKKLNLIGQQKPSKGKFFMKYNHGSGAAYSTFMGGDAKITQVKTSTNNGRNLLVIKDSFGNAVPGFLFHSFQEVHVVDFRYFTYNIEEYVDTHGITDILFANGIFNSCGAKMASQYHKFLSQRPYTPVPAPRANEDQQNKLETPLATEQQKEVQMAERQAQPQIITDTPVQPSEPQTPATPTEPETPATAPVETPIEAPIEIPIVEDPA